MPSPDVARPASDASHEVFAWLREDDTSVPVLPALAARVIEITGDPEVSVARVSAVVSKDQVLAARVLQLANSVYSSPLQTISTVTDAVVRLGTNSVRNVVVTVCLASRMHDPAIYGSRGATLVDHALGAAYLARLAAERGRVNTDEAFLAGLLHDIGKLVILKQAHDHFRRTGTPVDPTFVELALLERHAAMGSLSRSTNRCATTTTPWRPPPGEARRSWSTPPTSSRTGTGSGARRRNSTRSPIPCWRTCGSTRSGSRRSMPAHQG
jgi:hypothetical protein